SRLNVTPDASSPTYPDLDETAVRLVLARGRLLPAPAGDHAVAAAADGRGHRHAGPGLFLLGGRQPRGAGRARTVVAGQLAAGVDLVDAGRGLSHRHHAADRDRAD